MRSKQLLRVFSLMFLVAIFGSSLWALPAFGLPYVPLAPQADPSLFCNNVTEIPQGECEALYDMYYYTDGPNWIDNSEWLQNNTPCSWYNVTCIAGQVIDLSLFRNALNGFLPSNVGNLSALKRFYVYDNQNLTGPLPASLTALALDAFYFQNTQLCEPQDSTFQTWLSNIHFLGRTNIPCEALQVVIFAGDNDPTQPGSLADKYQALIDEIRTASVGETNKTSVILADLDGANDTQVVTIHNGTVTIMAEVPDLSGNLATGTTEYDMTDGAQLGGFLKWALTNYAGTNTKTTLSYYGHGTFLAPAIDDFEAALGGSSVPRSIFPLPFAVDAFPNYTDEHPKKSLITPYAIRQMLEIGTTNGAFTLDVLDLTHCFALSLEEVYEVTNEGGTPYAEMIVGSPNYNYFTPEMAGEAFAALDPVADAGTMATALIDAYESVMSAADLADGDPDVDHPRILTVIDSAALTNVKAIFDEMSDYLLNEFDSSADTVTKIQRAASNSLTYDTTYCQGDFDLTSADALVDVGTFLPLLADEFNAPPSSPNSFGVVLRALQARDLLENAIVAQTVVDGTPWFATSTPTWTFTANNALGISLYADFNGQVDGSDRILSWHSHFYTDTVSINHPHPYRFIESNNGATWADVFARYWVEEGSTLLTDGCLADLPPVVEQGEVTAEAITTPIFGTLHTGYPTPIKAKVRADTAISSLVVQFKVYDANNTTVFTNTVGAGGLVTGTYTIESSQPFTSTVAGNYTFEVTVDIDDRIQENNEADNTATHTDNAVNRAPFNLSVTMHDDLQWVQSNVVELDVISSTSSVDTLIFQLYEYQAGDNPNSQIPVLTQQWFEFNPATPLYQMILPAGVNPGHLVVHVWGVSGGRLSQSAEILHFNYAPPGSTLASGESTYYRFNAEAGDNVSISLSGSVVTRIWQPNNYWTAQQLTGSGSIPYNPATAGSYLVEVAGPGTYTISSVVNGLPNRSAASNVELVQKARPELMEPVVQAPDFVPTVVEGINVSAATSDNRLLIVVIILILGSLSGLVVRRNRQDLI